MTEQRVLKRLTKQQIQHILAQRFAFRRAQDLTGVPWQAIAAVWYRETFSVAPPTDRLGGQFQFDPPLTEKTMRAYLKKFVAPGKLTDAEINDLVKKGQENFAAATIFAACHLRVKAKPVIKLDSPDQDIADAFYGYNGRAYGSVDRSPYVMNYADFDHYEMRVYGTVLGKNGKKIEVVDDQGKRGRPNKQIGALVVYQQLKKELP